MKCGYNRKRRSRNILLSHPMENWLGSRITTARLVTLGTLCIINASNPEEFSLSGVLYQGLGHGQMEISVD